MSVDIEDGLGLSEELLRFVDEFRRNDFEDDLFAVLCSTGIPFAFAIIFFSKFLFRDYEIKSYKIQLIFALIFMFAVNMQALIIFEIIQIMSRSTRTILWKIDLVALIFMLMCLVPMYFFYTLVQYKRWRMEVKCLLIIVLETCYIFIFSR